MGGAQVPGLHLPSAENDLKSITSVQITAESFKEYFESFYTTHLATEAEITKYTGEVRITFAEKVRHFLTQYSS